MNRSAAATMPRSGEGNARALPDSTPREGKILRLTRHDFNCLLIGLISGALLMVGFMLIGSDLLITTILCAAWVVGWAAVAAGGGFKTLTGWFAFFPLFHFLLFSLPLKVTFWDGAEQGLRAPLSTSLVMLLFYAGLFMAALVCRITRVGMRPICSFNPSAEYYRRLAWICFLLGTAAYFLAMVLGQSAADGDSSGAGGMGMVHLLVYFQNFSIAAYIFYTWEADLKFWKQPVFWLFLISGLALGTLASEKAATSQPLVYLLLAMASIYGFRSYKMWAGFAIFGAILAGVIYPVMHFARGVDGARDGTLAQRVEVVGTVTAQYLTDPGARKDMKEQVDDYAEDKAVLYLPQSAGVFDRFIMIGPTDLLVAGVDQSSDAEKYHGFELFKLGLQLLVPRFFFAEKPDIGSSEFLADVAGTRNTKEQTYPTWGLPGELYYSFGLPGVFLGSFGIELIFFLLVNFWFGSRVRKSVWFCLLAVSLNMANSCAAIDSVPLLLMGLCVPALGLNVVASVLGRRTKFSAPA